MEKVIKVVLEQSTREKRFLQNCKTLSLALFIETFLNNRLVSNTLLTETVKSYKYSPLTSYYTLTSKLADRLRCI